MNSKSNYTKISLKRAEEEDNVSNTSSYGSAAEQTPTSDEKPIQPTRTVLKYSDKSNRYIVEPTPEPLVPNSLELHYYVFHNDVKKINDLILKLKRNQSKTQISEYLSIQDLHDNTPLHLCCMLGNYELARLLIDEGAVVKTRNKQMWTPLNEAISYGDRELIKCTLKKFEVEVEKIMDDTKPKVIEALKEMDDFYVEILVKFLSLKFKKKG